MLVTSRRPRVTTPAVAVLACALGAVLGGSACGRAPARAEGLRAGASASGRPVEIFSWWERVGDSDALGALIREQRRLHPADVIVNASAGLSGLARKTLRSRMLRSEPPDTFQANAGSDLMQWVLMNGTDARESKLLPLDGLVEGTDAWRSVMPAPVLEQVTFAGQLYGVPSNVHRINSVFYNKRLMARYGLAVPTSVADLEAMARKLDGTGVALIAVGSREPWTVALLVFECLLVAREGADTYRDYFHGHLRPDDPRIVRTLREALELFKSVNPDHARLSWLEAVDRVVSGQAVMTVMGDWARLTFNAHGLQMGVDYGEIAFPGTAGTFVFTSDTFSLPVEARNKAGARRLLATIGSADGQRAINDAKGSLSARFDVPPPAGDPILRQKFALLHDGALVLALSGIAPRVFSEDLASALAEMLSERDIEPVIQTLRSRYALLK
jgi:glucose/mannose transport system substrate-binding protein